MQQGQQTVNVRTKDKQLIPASLDALTQSTTFKQMFLDMNFELDDPELEFPVPAVNSDVFLKVLEWCDAHIGEPELEIKEDEHTRERIWFPMSKQEQEYLQMDVNYFIQILNAANYLDIKSLYLYGCQRVAAEIRGKSPEAIREMFELEDDLTDEEKEKLRRIMFGSMMHDVNRELRMMMYRMMSIVAQAKRQPEEIIYGTEGTNQMGLGNGPYSHDHYHQFNHQNADYNQNYNQFDVHSRSYRPHSPSLHNHQHHSAEEPHNFGNSTMPSHHHNDPTMFTQNHYGPHGVPHIHTHMPYLQNAQTGRNGNHGTYAQQQLHKHASKVHHKHH